MSANQVLFSLSELLSDTEKADGPESHLSVEQADDLLNHAVLYWLHRAEQYFQKTYPVPELDLSLRGKCAGQAYLQQWKVRFNLQLFRDNREAFIKEVVPHELAHLITFQEFGQGVRPHGKEWRWVMEQVMGVQARTTHRFDVTVSGRQNYLYRCGCPERLHPLTIRRHNRILKGADYICRQCGQILSFDSIRSSD